MIMFIIILAFAMIAEAIIIYYLVKVHKKENIFNSSETGKALELLRRFWGPFVIYVVATSVVGLFIASYYSEKNVTLEIMNTWVSLILGMVALVIGVISLFLSFYNVDQSVQASKENKTDIEKMQDNFKNEMNELRKSIEKKIEDSSEKTINEVKGKYNKNTDTSIEYYNTDNFDFEEGEQGKEVDVLE